MIRVERGFSDDDRHKAAAMFWEAFEGKLNRCMGPKAKALMFLQEHIRPSFSFSAYDGDTLLGLVGFKAGQGGFVGGDYRDLAHVYGHVSAIWRGIVLSQFERDLEEGQLLLDGIFVSHSARSMGVGTALLNAIEQFGRAELYREIRLDVIDTNIKAKALYEREGFVSTAQVRTGVLQPLLGFSSATTMIKTL
jgi:ribosomal protein S18 acetylase RimI-like enzyme